MSQREQLVAEWRKEVYDNAKHIDRLSDKGGADYESLCVGWCLAKGLSLTHAFNFYRNVLIPRNLY